MLMNRLERAADRAVVPQSSRRGFLIGASAFAGGLMVGFRPMAALAQTTALNPFAGYVAIAPDGTVTVYSAHMDMGQGIYHGIATLVNEELMADWAKIRVEGGSANPAYYGNVAWGGKIQGTGGSTGIPSSFDRYRTAGAAARLML
ncbi:MAG: molybdopterin cofactor-binding domain-containing protein, partial [Rhodoplanes sp.]